MECELSKKRCIPCEGGIPPLTGDELRQVVAQLGGGWQVIDQHHIEKAYQFRDFRESLEFVNQLGEIAETEGHHPDILLSWGQVHVMIYTHKIDGLTESDFILAAKYERCHQTRSNVPVETH
jgi:4a-hydroxytetrahydrobiopterin dehydratase